jgi:hypothetical protein
MMENSKSIVSRRQKWIIFALLTSLILVGVSLEYFFEVKGLRTIIMLLSLGWVVSFGSLFFRCSNCNRFLLRAEEPKNPMESQNFCPLCGDGMSESDL